MTESPNITLSSQFGRRGQGEEGTKKKTGEDGKKTGRFFKATGEFPSEIKIVSSAAITA
jgi:hypothetical protein